MRRSVLSFLLCFLSVAVAMAATVDERVRALEPVVASLRGLDFQRSPDVEVIDRGEIHRRLAAELGGSDADLNELAMSILGRYEHDHIELITGSTIPPVVLTPRPPSRLAQRFGSGDPVTLTPTLETARPRATSLASRFASGLPIEAIVNDAPAHAPEPAYDDISDETIAHELAHALVDQRFNLHALVASAGDDIDRLIATQMLVEGDATFVELSYLTWRDTGSGIDPHTMTISPSAAVAMLSVPDLYLTGNRFIANGVKHGGWEVVDRAYRYPPTTTEQVLHPEKYFDVRDQPMRITLPDESGELGTGWIRVEDLTMGEYLLSELLTAPVAAGWDGDRFDSYANADGDFVVVWMTAWDTTLDAEEFMAILPPPLTGDVAAERHDNTVLVVMAPTHRDAILSSVWHTAITSTQP